MTWATSVSILVFLGLSLLDLGPMYATDRRQRDVKRALSLNASALWGRGHNNPVYKLTTDELQPLFISVRIRSISEH